MKNEDRYFEMVRQASENVSKYIKQYKAKKSIEEEDDGWNEHEATWKALLFHELILSDEKVKDYLSMENKANTTERNTINKRFDFWIQDSEIGINYVLEVKLIHHKRRKNGIGFTKLNSDTGVYGDLMKINQYLTSENVYVVKGISIAVSLNSGVDVNEVIQKVDVNLKEMLNDDLRLLICSNGKCEYVPANKESK